MILNKTYLKQIRNDIKILCTTYTCVPSNTKKNVTSHSSIHLTSLNRNTTYKFPDLNDLNKWKIRNFISHIIKAVIKFTLVRGQLAPNRLAPNFFPVGKSAIFPSPAIFPPTQPPSEDKD